MQFMLKEAVGTRKAIQTLEQRQKKSMNCVNTDFLEKFSSHHHTIMAVGDLMVFITGN